MNESLPPPIWVDTPQALKRMIDDLQCWPQLAVDTESNGLHAYREQVCLIQISTPENDYLIDPLKLRDLQPLAPIFADAGVEKIFHAAGYDLLCLYRDFGFKVFPLFDTMHAARVLGQRAVGLDALLERYFHVQLDKRHQKADWAERPLSAERMEYARLDTHYLIPLRQILGEELQQSGRWELAQEDFQRMSLEALSLPAHPPRWERLAHAHALTGRQRTLLQALWEWREETARQLNRPPFKVIGETVLLQLVRTPPQGLYDLTRCGLSGRQVRIWGEAILRVVERAQMLEVPKYVPPPTVDAARLDRLEQLKAWRKRVAQRWGVESDVILPRSLLERLAQRNPLTWDELQQVLNDSPWRLRTFGEELLAVLRECAAMSPSPAMNTK